MSGEHYISEAVIRATQPRALAHKNTVRILHPRWAPELRDIGIASLTANILCASHNAMLSPLDAEAGELWLSIRSLIDVDIDPSACPRVRLLNGNDIERWMLKVLLSSFYGGYETQSSGSKLRLPVPIEELAAKLINLSLWKNNSGLYVDTVPDRDALFAFRTINRDDTIIAAEFYMFGVRMFFLPCPVDDPTVIVPASACHRPDGFAFRIDNDLKFIAFSWNPERRPLGSDTWIRLARGPLGGTKPASPAGRA